MPWEERCLSEANKFTAACAALRETNPHDRPSLDIVMIDLVTELWDQFFSQTEIRNAVEKALSRLLRDAAGEERRGDKEQPDHLRK